MSSEGLTPEEHATFILEALARGETVWRSHSRQLLIDLDLEEDFVRFKRVADVFLRYYGTWHIQWWKSRSGVGRHVVLHLDEPMDLPTRVAFQAALGSDGVKEVLTLIRASNGVEEPSLLFQPKDAVVYKGLEGFLPREGVTE